MFIGQTGKYKVIDYRYSILLPAIHTCRTASLPSSVRKAIQFACLTWKQKNMH